jgi:uncharacterized protein YjcR
MTFHATRLKSQGRSYTTKVYNSCRTRYENGETLRLIARSYGNSPSIATLYAWKRENGWTRDPNADACPHCGQRINR